MELPPFPGSFYSTALVRINGDWTYLVTGTDLRSDAKIVMSPPAWRAEFTDGRRIDDEPRPKRPQTFVPFE